jgi:hypothetical protein
MALEFSKPGGRVESPTVSRNQRTAQTPQYPDCSTLSLLGQMLVLMSFASQLPVANDKKCPF